MIYVLLQYLLHTCTNWNFYKFKNYNQDLESSFLSPKLYCSFGFLEKQILEKFENY